MAQELAKAAASRFVGQAGLRTNLWRFVSFLGGMQRRCISMFYDVLCICMYMYMYVYIYINKYSKALKAVQLQIESISTVEQPKGLWQVSSRARTASPRWAWTDLGRVAQQGSF